ncbi:hypothetical protein Taro_047412 [Colocasia esculenta]|uniref:Glycoside hydrolase family 31 N-terminal domain-containing protein n=1 Tax=Colocasia esculenta TaxID=4460 RepID=A0A843X3U1_COLES|nr:hypothetical protein [Colocasia esculenta]
MAAMSSNFLLFSQIQGIVIFKWLPFLLGASRGENTVSFLHFLLLLVVLLLDAPFHLLGKRLCDVFFLIPSTTYFIIWFVMVKVGNGSESEMSMTNVRLLNDQLVCAVLYNQLVRGERTAPPGASPGPGTPLRRFRLRELPFPLSLLRGFLRGEPSPATPKCWTDCPAPGRVRNMLSLRTVRRVCAAFDTVALIAIAAGLSKPKVRPKSDIAASADIPVNPSSPKQETHLNAAEVDPTAPHPDTDSVTISGERPELQLLSEPALIRLKKEKDPEKLFLLFRSNAQNRFVVENRFAFEDTVSRLAGARRFDLIEQLLEQQKALPQGRREGFIVRIIMLYGKAQMPYHALRTFDEMHLRGCPRTVKSFNATLRVLCQTRSYDEIQTFFHDASVKYGISVDEISCNILIKAMCELGSLESAYLAMVAMEEAGIRPDVVTYTTLMAASYKHDRREIGDGLWNLMVIRGCSPNLATFNVRIQYLINKNRAWQARSLMKKMVDSDIKPDELTFNLIIKGFCRMGEIDMAKRIFMTMHSRRCKPNGKIYQTMVHYLCKAGDLDVACMLCKESMKRNWFPSIPTIQKLLEGLVSISKEKDAREIMKLVRGKLPTGSNVYETGEVSGPLERTGRHVFTWNTDAWGFGLGTTSLYRSLPWVLALLPDRKALVVLADTTRCMPLSIAETLQIYSTHLYFVLYGLYKGYLVVAPTFFAGFHYEIKPQH